MKSYKPILLFVLLIGFASCTTSGNSNDSVSHSLDDASNQTTTLPESITDDTDTSSPSFDSSTSDDIFSSDDISSESSSDSSKDSSSDSGSSSSSETSSSSSSSGGFTPGGNDLYDATLLPNYPDDYYEPVRGLSGENLKQALHEIINDHTTFNYSDTTPYFKTIDKDPNNSNNIMMFYEGSTNGSENYNKEHVWAKSHGKFGTSAPAGSDLHNLHPCDSDLNSTRGNLDFAEGGTLLTGYKGNNRRVNNVSFEPSDDFKGDTARTIFYMAVRYEGDKGNEPDLELDSPSSSQYRDFSSGGNKGLHGRFDDLYKWATSGQDPVNDYEVSRNNIIYSNYQHNRNPFIDHPEFIQMIYDKNYLGPGALLDMNPMGENKSQDELVDDFKAAVDAIGQVTLASLSAIENAEEIYLTLDDISRTKVQSWYQKLVTARVTYDALWKEQAVQETIKAIDAIGEVTLSSKEAIEYAESLYNALDASQKAQVTNYAKLVAARETYNQLYDELPLKETTFVDEDFSKSQGASGSYKASTVTLGNVSFSFSYCYQTGGEFRFGRNSSATIQSNLLNALGIGEADGSYFISNQIFERLNYINLTTGKKYGTINNVYFLISTDNGSTYQVIKTFDNVTSTQLTYEDEEGFAKAKLAVVITGSSPRLVLNHLTLKGFKEA